MVTSLPDAQVYAKQLLLKRHGYPLWVPEPYGNSVAYRTKGVRIGDVGYVTPDGAFETLFNLRAARTDPINFRGVPEGFGQVVVPEEDIVHIPNYHQSNSTVTSASAKKRNVNIELATPDLSTGGVSAGASAQFTWNSSEGAILHLPDGASRLTSPAEVFRDAALRGAKNWYKFANVALHRGVPNGSLYLVTGCDKCRSWMVGSFSDTSSDCQASLKLDAACFGAAGVSYSYAWETSSPAVYRTGPHPSVDSCDVLSRHGPSIVRDDEIFYLDAPSGQNQCVFLRGYRIMLRTNPVSSMLGISTKVDVDSILSANPKDISRPPAKGPYAHSGGMPNPHTDSSQSGGAGITNSMDFLDHDHEVTLRYYPNVSHPYHPSDAINDYLLSIVPHATVAVTHDDDWCSVIQDGEPSIPNEDVLISRISNRFAIVNADASAFLCLKGPNNETSTSVENACDPCMLLPPETSNRPVLNESRTFPNSESGREPHCIPPSSKARVPQRVSAQYSPTTFQAKDTKRKDSGTWSAGSGQSSRLSYLSDLSNSSPRTFVENREDHTMSGALRPSLVRDRHRGISETTESAENTLTCPPPSLPRKRLKPNGRPNTAPSPSTYSKRDTFKTIRRQRSFDV